jgi:hypothetical protein
MMLPGVLQGYDLPTVPTATLHPRVVMLFPFLPAFLIPASYCTWRNTPEGILEPAGAMPVCNLERGSVVAAVFGAGSIL